MTITGVTALCDDAQVMCVMRMEDDPISRLKVF